MASFRVDSDLDRLAGNAYRAEAVLRRELLGAMTAITADAERQSVLTAPVNRGFYRASIGSSVAIAGGFIRGEVFAGGGVVDYARPINEGRRPGARMPPVGAIREYLRLTGGDPGRAFVVARAIARRGIPPRPHIKRSVERAAADAPRHIRPALGRAVATLGGR